MIQNYLSGNVLVITEDAHVEKLKKSAEELSKKLLKNKTKIVEYTIVALDPHVLPNNSHVLEVKEMILKNWSTFSANAKDTPLTYIRVVILTALQKISADLNFANLIWLTGRNLVKFLKITGVEKDIISLFIYELGTKVNQKAIQEWALESNSSDEKEITTPILDKALLQKYMEYASGPTNEAGAVPFKEPNSSWPSEGPPWSYKFTPRISFGISFVVNKALKEYTTEISTHLKKNMQSSKASTLSLKMRSDLLWWKESCYSNSLNSSYYDIPDGILQMALANDYASMIPLFYPVSVDYFLRQTHRSIKEDSTLTFLDFMNAVGSSPSQSGNILPTMQADADRITLLCFISGTLTGKFTISDFEKVMGFSEKSEVTLSQITQWLFHDFQVNKIITSK